MKRRDYLSGKEMTVSEYNGWFNRVVSQNRVTRRQKHALSRQTMEVGESNPHGRFALSRGHWYRPSSGHVFELSRRCLSSPLEAGTASNACHRVNAASSMRA